MRSATWLAAMLVLASGCGNEPRRGAPTPAAAPSPPPAPGELSEGGVGSGAFHLDLAGVYERYGDLRTAAEHYEQAAEKTQDPGHALQVALGLSRLREAAGDTDGAIRALEGVIAGGGDPDRLRQAVGQAVALQARAGRLAARVEEIERAAARGGSPREADLWFLALACGEEAASPIAPARAVEVHERLLRLHPDDAALRERLLAWYARTGRLEDAVELVEAAPRCGTEAEGRDGEVQSPDRDLVVAEQVVRVYQRADKKARALDETKQLLALAATHGAHARVVAARLFAELGDMAEAERVLAEGERVARSPDERRTIALGRAELLERQVEAEGASEPQAEL